MQLSSCFWKTALSHAWRRTRLRCAAGQQERAEAWTFHPRSFCGTPATPGVAASNGRTPEKHLREAILVLARSIEDQDRGFRRPGSDGGVNVTQLAASLICDTTPRIFIFAPREFSFSHRVSASFGRRTSPDPLPNRPDLFACEVHEPNRRGVQSDKLGRSERQ